MITFTISTQFPTEMKKSLKEKGRNKTMVNIMDIVLRIFVNTTIFIRLYAKPTDDLYVLNEPPYWR